MWRRRQHRQAFFVTTNINDAAARRHGIHTPACCASCSTCSSCVLMISLNFTLRFDLCVPCRLHWCRVTLVRLWRLGAPSARALLPADTLCTPLVVMICLAQHGERSRAQRARVLRDVGVVLDSASACRRSNWQGSRTFGGGCSELAHDSLLTAARSSSCWQRPAPAGIWRIERVPRWRAYSLARRQSRARSRRSQQRCHWKRKGFKHHGRVPIRRLPMTEAGFMDTPSAPGG